MFGFFRYFTMIILGSGWQLLQKVPSINAKKLNIWLKTSKNSDVPRNNRKYLEIPSNTRKYPTVKSIPENTRSYISRLLPDPNPTRYPVFFPISDLILKNPDFFSISSASNAKKPLRLDQPFQNNLITTDFPCRAFWISMPLIDAVTRYWKTLPVGYISTTLILFHCLFGRRSCKKTPSECNCLICFVCSEIGANHSCILGPTALV